MATIVSPSPKIVVYTTEAKVPFRIFQGHSDDINLVRVTSDRKILASVSDDHDARIWALEPLRMKFENGEVVPAPGSVGGRHSQGCIHILKGHEAAVSLCVWAPKQNKDLTETLLLT